MRKIGSKNKEPLLWPEGHKECVKCKQVKPFLDFHRHKECLFGYNTICKVCRIDKSKAGYESTSIEYRLYTAAKHRAKTKKREFSIELSDLSIPDLCPILKKKIEYNGIYSPSLDRIDSNKGYIKGNIQVISKRANTLKNNATVEELQLILQSLTKGNCEI